ncbi:hypothetical protein V1478_010747 [Vespula squamosa]|uniref:Pre-C2HC domain-containing protein n=1 Tax=Vespula squamosa TaxID=30214 RepID=A0ABD2AHZ0_VESSQ
MVQCFNKEYKGLHRKQRRDKGRVLKNKGTFISTNPSSHHSNLGSLKCVLTRIIHQSDIIPISIQLKDLATAGTKGKLDQSDLDRAHGHTSVNCNKAYKCLKCADFHDTRTCKKSPEVPVSV